MRSCRAPCHGPWWQGLARLADAFLVRSERVRIDSFAALCLPLWHGRWWTVARLQDCLHFGIDVLLKRGCASEARLRDAEFWLGCGTVFVSLAICSNEAIRACDHRNTRTQRGSLRATPRVCTGVAHGTRSVPRTCSNRRQVFEACSIGSPVRGPVCRTGTGTGTGTGRSCWLSPLSAVVLFYRLVQ